MMKTLVALVAGLCALPSFAAEPFMTIRLWPQHHDDPTLFNQTLAALTKYRAACDEVWFCTEDGFPPLAVHEASARRMAEAADAYRRAGIVPSLQIGMTLGHCDNFSPTDCSQLTWGTMVGEDGVKAKTVSCPRRPAFLDYVRARCAAYAVVRPHSVWLDDDMRLASHGPVALGCFCDDCLADFAKRTGVKRSREELNAARKADPAVAKSWAEFSRESLGLVARASAEGFHRVSPETRMALQNGGSSAYFDGCDHTEMLAPMWNVTGLPLGYRAGGGVYDDANPRDLVLKAYGNAEQWLRLPEYVERRVPEVENFPHVATSKTPEGTAVESFVNLALGANGLSYAISCSGQETVDWYATHLYATLAEWRPFLEGFSRHVAGTVSGGIRPSVGRWYELAFIGFPIVPPGASAGVYAEALTDLTGLPDDELRARLAKGALMGGSAALEVQKRGLGDLLGAKATVRSNAFLRETLNDGSVWSVMLVSWPLVQFAPMEDAAKTLGRAEDGAVVSLQTTNASGGRVALFGAAGPDSFVSVLSTSRRRQLLDAFDWVSGGKLPVLAETACRAFVLPRVTESGDLRAVAVVNSSIGRQDPVRLRLRGVAPGLSSAVWHTPEAADVPLEIRREGGDAAVELPPLEGWHCGWLEL